MTGVHLVRGEVDQVEAGRRDVDVQNDAAREIAEVVVERPPRLVADGLECDLLPGGKRDQGLGHLAQHGQQIGERRDRQVAVDGVAHAPRRPSLEERPVARQELVERGMRSLVDAHRRLDGPHAVAGLHLVGVPDLLAVEHARVGRTGSHLVVEPPVGKLREQCLGVRNEAPRRDDVLRIHLILQLGRPVVGVDEPLDVPAEPQSELQVTLGRRHDGTSNSAACPWPTPTHIVATPRPPPRRRSSCRRLTTSRAPLIPSGWPIAIAPPFTFTCARRGPAHG